MTAGGKGAEGDVDLEDKIIKEVRWVVSVHLGRKLMLIMNLNLLPCPHNSLSKTAHIYPGTYHTKCQ
jgi:hypothetical protein